MRRMIFFYADDFGYNSSIDNEIIRLYKMGKIKSFSILSDYLLLASKNSINFVKNKKATIHINLIEGKKYDILIIFVIKLFLGLVDLKAIKKDIQRQIDILKKFEIKIIQLNSHQHIHALYPISKIFISLAKKNKIPKIRSYQNLKAQTLRGKLCIILLKMTSYLSSIRYASKFSLPETWRFKSNNQYYMSWEDKGFSMNKVEDKKTDIIIHPGSEFDKNSNFVKYL